MIERTTVISSGPLNSSTGRFSWSAIFAGVFMALAIFLTLMMLGLSLGLAVMDFENGVSLTASGWFSGLWTVLSFLAALALATYSTARLTGYTTLMAGVLNGLTVWAVVSLTLFYMVGRGSGQMISKTSKAVSQPLKGLTESVTAGVIGQGDIPKIRFRALENMYKDLDAPELKKSIEQELESLKEKAQDVAKNTLINPDSAKSNLNQLKESAQESVSHIRDEYDRDKIASIIARNSKLTEEEAQRAAAEWEIKLDNMDREMDKLFTQLEKDVIQAADSTKNVVAASSFLMFLFLGLGFIVSIVSSFMATKQIKETLIPF